MKNCKGRAESGSCVPVFYSQRAALGGVPKATCGPSVAPVACPRSSSPLEHNFVTFLGKMGWVNAFWRLAVVPSSAMVVAPTLLLDNASSPRFGCLLVPRHVAVGTGAMKQMDCRILGILCPQKSWQRKKRTCQRDGSSKANQGGWVNNRAEREKRQSLVEKGENSSDPTADAWREKGCPAPSMVKVQRLDFFGLQGIHSSYGLRRHP